LPPLAPWHQVIVPAFANDGAMHSIATWNVESRNRIHSFADDSTVSYLEESPKGTPLATGNGSSKVKLWGPRKGTLSSHRQLGAEGFEPPTPWV
jgi:WD40 repeat protein